MFAPAKSTSESNGLDYRLFSQLMADPNDAGQLEQLGDTAESRDAATAYYRKAQLLLMPPGVVWTGGEEYDRRMEAFERIQQKLYGLSGREFPRIVDPPPPSPETSSAHAPADAADMAAHGLSGGAFDLPVWDFSPGLVVRVEQTFVDHDGQEVREGDVLHFLDSSYPYEGGHTLRFREKTIRLATIDPEEEAIIANAGNAWFRPISNDPP